MTIGRISGPTFQEGKSTLFENLELHQYSSQSPSVLIGEDIERIDKLLTVVALRVKYMYKVLEF